MESNEPKPYAQALRRFLISSSSSSATSPARGDAAAAAPRSARLALNTSSVSSDASTASSSAATSARHYSHHSTPPHPRLQHAAAAAAAEKVELASPLPDAQPAVAVSSSLRRRSRSSDSVESHDSVDALATSAFQDFRSAHHSLAQQLLSLSVSSPVAAESTAAEKEEEEEEAASKPTRGQEEGEKLLGSSQDVYEDREAAAEKAAEVLHEAADHSPSHSSIDDRDLDVDVGVDDEVEFFSPITATDVESPFHHNLATAASSPAVVAAAAVRDEARSGRTIINAAAATADSPSSVDDVPARPATLTIEGEGAGSPDSTTNTSSSRHQVGVWKAIYGKEKWTGPRRSCSREEAVSEDITTSNTEDRHDAPPVAAIDGGAATASSRTAPPQQTVEEETSSAAVVDGGSGGVSSRHGDSTQWAATRRTALEMLRAQLDTSEAKTPRGGDGGGCGASRGQRTRTSQPVTPATGESTTRGAVYAEAAAFVDKDEEAADFEPSFEVVEVHQMPAAASEVVNEASSSERHVDPEGKPTERRRRSAEEVLEALFSGLPTQPASSNVLTTSPVRRVQAAGLPLSPLSGPSASSAPPRLVIRPTLSTDVSGISPIKNEAPSLLAPLDDTPEMRPTARAVGWQREEEQAGRRAGPLHTSTPSSPVEQRRRRSGQLLSEGRGDYTMNLSAMDFRTAQTLPTSTSTTSATPDRSTEQDAREEERSATPTLLPPQRPASALRSDRKISVFPAAAANAWDASRVPAWRSKDQPEALLEVAPVECTAVSVIDRTPAAVRQERVRAEMRAKELAECSFHPTLSPGTRAMVRVAQERELERALTAAAPPPPSRAAPGKTARPGTTTRATATRTPPLASTESKAAAPSTMDPRKLKATLQNVYERLYPLELAAAASRRQILDQEMEYRRLAREELIMLRQKAGVVRRVARGRGVSQARDTFDTFLCSVLRTDAVPTPGATRTAATAATVLETSYMSPMAVALQEERQVKRQSHSRREAELNQSHSNTTSNNHNSRMPGDTSGMAQQSESSTAEDSFRIALFDEFLLRQNAYYFNRTRTVRDLERQLTPAFTPTTTQKSTRLVQEMVSRSLVNDSMGPETSSMLAQRQRQHIPVGSSLVAPHQSPYRDPCTFHPQLSPSARAAKAAERDQRHAMNRAIPTAHQKAFFDRLYGDHARIAKQKAQAREAAAVAEMVGVTFAPQVNGGKREQGKSVLDPANYGHYQEALLRKRESLEEQRQAQVDKSAEAEEVLCTFRPQTTKTPAYISKMAKNFGVLRQQDTEF